MDKKGCGSMTTMGHGDMAVCGQVWWDKVYECQSCQIKRLTAERAWQPIETAPTDGSAFLAFDSTPCPLPYLMFFVARWHHNYSEDEADGYWSNIVGDCDMCHPTHWMLLPSPPEG